MQLFLYSETSHKKTKAYTGRGLKRISHKMINYPIKSQRFLHTLTFAPKSFIFQPFLVTI